MSNSKRKSSIELLRVISMFMVVAYHWFIHADGDGIIYSSLSSNQVFSFGIGSWGTLGVDVFFIISAYFLINSNSIKLHKLINVIIKVSIYGTAVVLVAVCVNIIPFEIITFMKSVLGVFAYQYWFMTVYVVVYVLHPALNKVIKDTSFKYAMLLTGVLICISYFTGFAFGEGQFVGRLSCAVTIYILIGMLEKYPKLNIFERFRGIGTICSLVGIFMLEIVLSYLGNEKNMSFFFRCINKIQNTDSVFMLIASLFMFYFFKNLNLKSNSVINFIGKYVVGAYMLHGGAAFIKDFLWDDFFSAGLYYHKPFAIYATYYLMCVFALLIVGVLVEYIYTHLIEKQFEKIYKKIKLTESI